MEEAKYICITNLKLDKKMKTLKDILALVTVAVEAMLWADDMERNICREDFPGL